MIQFIVGITLIALFIEFPSMLFTVSIILGCVYFYVKRPDLVAKLGIRIPTEYKKEEKEDILSADRPEFVTTEEKMAKAEAEIDARMKPGYKDDPEWQEKSKQLNLFIEKNQVIADKEMKIEMLKEAEQHAQAGEWNKVEAIERKIQDMAAKSSD